MSRIYFHSPSEDVEVMGVERYLMGRVISKLAWSLMEDRAESLRKVLKKNHYAHSYEGNQFKQTLETALLVSWEPLFEVDGKDWDGFHLSLNTCLAIGGDSLKLFARLHAQCEIHAWVAGKNRAWMAKIIAEGLESGLYRQNVGWDQVIEMLGRSKTEPVVTSYSVCEQFPSREVANWEDDNDGDDWYDLDSETRWKLAMKGLKNKTGKLELTPKWDRYRFGDGKTVFDLLKVCDQIN